MSSEREQYSYLHSASPVPFRKPPRVQPLKFSEFGLEKDKKNVDVRSEVGLERDRRNVYLRIKPKDGKGNSFKVIDEHTLAPASSDSQRKRKAFSQQFKFTKIFGPDSKQGDIFKETCTIPLTNFLNGGNCLVFAYGATNAGKSYTIQGSAKNPGIIPRALNLLFNSIKDKVSDEVKFKPDKLINVLWLSEEDIQKELEIKRVILNFNIDKSKPGRSASALSLISDGSQLGCSSSSDSSVLFPCFQSMFANIKNEGIELEDDPNSVYSIWVSYAELYNENVYDLLQPLTKNQKPLLVGENEKREVFIKNLTEVCVFSAEEAYKVFLYGKHNLHQASTSINHVSSRSHSIFSIKLVKYLKVDCPTFARISMCTFVDLAGAERAKKTKNIGERLKESQSINTSLHVLGKCLEVLRQNQKNKETVARMLPCRESKLTRLFQRALEGKEVLTMIVNINQDENLLDETMNVLKFSAIAMELQFHRRHDSTMCSLRRSSLSMYMSKLSSSLQSSMEAIEETTDDARYMKLLTYIEELKGNVEEEKKKNLTLEIQVRKEAYTNFRKIMMDMKNSYKQRLKDEREAYAEYEEVNANLYRQFLHNAQKRRRDDSDGESSSDSEDDDYEEKIQFLQNKVEALKGLVEAGEKTKSDHVALQAKHSKLQFELATVKQELESALKINEVIGQGDGAHDVAVRELQEQLVKHQNLVKERNSEIEKLNKLLEIARMEYEEHFKEHEDFATQNAELEKMIAERDLKIEEMQAQLKICNKKLSEQQERHGNSELEQTELTVKLQQACEDRDEFKFKVSSLESQIRKLEKENEALQHQPKTPDTSEVKVLELLVASHEDQLKQYEEKLKNQTEANRVLEEEVSHLKSSSVSSSRDSFVKEINILESEIKESLKTKKELSEKTERISQELQQTKEALKLAEMALTDEQTNTKAMRKICESEKDKLQDAVQHLQVAVKELEDNCEKLLRENRDLKLHNMELEEAVKEQEEQMEAFKSRRNAQFETYENLLKHEREMREREQREVHQMHHVMRTLTPKKSEYLADIAKLKDELKAAYIKVAELQREKKSCIQDISNNVPSMENMSKGRTRRQKKELKENALDDSLETNPVVPEITIKPDPDGCRNLRPRRKKALYTSDDSTKCDVGIMQTKTSRR